MTTWTLLYYLCLTGNGCWHYVPVEPMTHDKCVEEVREYRRTQIRYFKRMGLGDGDAVCLPMGDQE